MKSDIELAQEAEVRRIVEVADKVGILEEELELYGNKKAKLSNELWKRIKKQSDGKLVLVTAITPTPAGEGKTTTSIGLAQALWQTGKKAVLALREPSLGPCMGMKGGATGGGYAQVLPMEDINLHFTGDIHAVGAANNLLSAIIDNHIQQGNELGIDPRQILWKRAVDINDRALRQIVVGLGGKSQGMPRQDGFNITVASEIMAILCLAEDLADLKKRLERIVVAYNFEGKPIFASDLGVVGALATLLKDALKPNLVQTMEHTPVVMHGGPFANIAHGCNSILATKYALKLGEIAITEAGFGADLGAEKFFDIKCRMAGLKPDAVVLVATVRSLKYNGGVELSALEDENLAALEKGIVNLEAHIENLQKFGVPVLVALNVFATDTEEEIAYIENYCRQLGADFSRAEVWEKGGVGGLDLARALLKILEQKKSDFAPIYEVNLSIKEKIEAIARQIYGAKTVKFTPKAAGQMKKIEQDKMADLPICVAKTQYSLSDNPALLGRPQGFEITVSELRISNGAGFIVALAGDIMTMPGLPKNPAAERIGISDQGVIRGLF